MAGAGLFHHIQLKAPLRKNDTNKATKEIVEQRTNEFNHSTKDIMLTERINYNHSTNVLLNENNGRRGTVPPHPAQGTSPKRWHPLPTRQMSIRHSHGRFFDQKGLGEWFYFFSFLVRRWGCGWGLGFMITVHECASHLPGAVLQSRLLDNRWEPIPNSTSSESSRRDVATADFFLTPTTVPTVQISSVANRHRGVWYAPRVVHGRICTTQLSLLLAHLTTAQYMV